MKKETEEKITSEKEEVKNSKSKKIINIFILLVMLSLGLVMYAKYIGVSGLSVYEYRIESEKIPSNFSGVKIVQFSDLLYGSTVDSEDVTNLVNKINELKPDLVFFTGGLISESKSMSEEEINELSSILKEINSSLGKYAVRGDEDADVYDIVMKDSGFTVLSNSGSFIYNKGLTPIYVGGFASYLKDSINVPSTFEVIDNDPNKDAYYKILLLHEGDAIDSLFNERSDAHLILAGNSLGGSIRIPFYKGVYYPSGSTVYNERYYEKGETKIFVSSGLGTEKVGYRFNNRPSFNFYRLKSL